MPDPSTYRPAPGTIPEQPGVYRFRDPTGRVIYVGKAKSLRQRLNSYFADVYTLHPRTHQMVTTASAVDWVTVTNEVEALQLEYAWIKEFDPRFNIRYRDDKSYPFLAVTFDEEYPRLQVMRGAKRKGVRYFGPYSHAWAIRETLDLLLRVFPARTCSAGVFKRAAQIGRPCLLGDIGRCSAPCVGRVTVEEHRQIALDFCEFMAGRTDSMVRRVEREMHEASAALEFEQAARLRDDLIALRRALEKQAVVLGDGTNADVVAFADDGLQAAVAVFHVRDGRVRGERGWVVDKTEEASLGDLVHHFCTQVYGDEQGQVDVPREVLVPELPADAEALSAWLAERRGTRVTLRVPQRGDKKALAETVRRNAEGVLTQHKLRRASDLTSRGQALEELAEALGMSSVPLRIECYDVSQIQGTDVVASMVVFEDGLARKGEYRRFAVTGAVDDLSALSQVLRRRFTRYREATGGVASTGAGPAWGAALAEGGPAGDGPAGGGATGGALVAEGGPAGDGPVESALVSGMAQAGGGRPVGVDEAGAPEDRSATAGPASRRAAKFAYPPQLLVVDGGAPQANAAAEVLAEFGITDITVCGLAKRLEEVWLPADEYPVILPRTSEGLYLLQRLRDEAHRFAITYHRQRRSKRMTLSELENIDGLGEARRKALLRQFGSVKRLSEASVEEIAAIPGIGKRTAEAIVTALHGRSSPPPS